jgi:hypothetical protein
MIDWIVTDIHEAHAQDLEPWDKAMDQLGDCFASFLT